MRSRVSGTARLATVAVVLLAMITAGGLSPWAATVTATSETGTASNFELVGHNPLFARGMNAAPALYNDAGTGRSYLYVGSRTDSSAGHLHAGVLIVDTTDPANPNIIKEIGAPHEGGIGETSRELRVWPEQKLLAVLHFTCSSIIHACDPVTDNVSGTQQNIVFYDLTDPTNPVPVLVYEPTFTPHEIFLWVDPVNAGRALLYFSVPSSSTHDPNLVVVDISGVARQPREQPAVLATWSANGDIEAAARRDDDVRLHSIGVSPDGTRTYLAYLGAGFLVLDTSPLTNPDLAPPVALQLRTEPGDRAKWGNPGTHSAVEVFGSRIVNGVERKYALTTDEVYGELITPLQAGKGKHGCPWGWTRVLDITDEAHPVVVGEYKIAQNDPASCATPPGVSADPAAPPAAPAPTPAYACVVVEGYDPTATALASYSSHNPTVLKNLALITWHGGGLQAVDLSDPTNPVRGGEFIPAPLPSVATEDPALSSGLTKVVMWSYPILNRQNGQTYIYVIDVRNGLYILRYTGVNSSEVDGVSFLEGNSNLGDALQLDGWVPPPAGQPPATGLTFGSPAATTFNFDTGFVTGDAQRVAEFGNLDDGPRMGIAQPAGPSKVQSLSRFGNPGLAANPLLSYFSYSDPVKVTGSPTLRVWLSAPGALGVVRLPLTVELFVDGTPRYGSASATGSWIPITFNVDVGPVPTEVNITLPPLDATALDSLVIQLGVSAVNGHAPAAALLYGSPQHQSALSGSLAFPI